MVAIITFQFAILLLSQIHFGHVKPWTIHADVTPNNPKIEDGGVLLLNCTLRSSYNGPHNASDIYFSHFSKKNFTYPDVQTLSNTTAQLRLTNFTSAIDGRYTCKLPEPDGRISDAQTPQIVKKLLRPVLESCVVSNWEKMECSWSPNQTEQDKFTIQKLYYQHSGDNDTWQACPQIISSQKSEKCIWPSSDFTMGGNYCIQINVTNKQLPGYVVSSNVTCFLANNELVRPNPPEYVLVSFASEFNGHVTLTWNPPTSSYNYEKPLIYQLDISNQWDDKISNVTTETSMQLSVVPATKYTFEISVRPARLGFASDKVVLGFETNATVPCKNPHIPTNAFSLVKESRKILLYWQPISERDFCGIGLSYQVRAKKSRGATNGADIWRNVSSVASSDVSAEVTLLGDEDEVTVQSKNSIGLANHLPHIRLRLPSSSWRESLSLSHELVVEGDLNSVIVSGFATAALRASDDVTSCTLFWCKRKSLTTHICQSPIQWQNLDGTKFEYNLTLSENYLHFQIGLAVNFLSGTTGIMWAEKLYSQIANADPPHIEAPYLGSHGEIDISWTAAQCHNQRCAYVHTFVISYCLADYQDNCQGAIQNVSVPSWKNFTYTLTNLEHGSAYRIWMTSVARTGSSETSGPVYATTTKSWFTSGRIAGIVVAIICGGTVAIGGLYVILRCINSYRKKFVNGLPIALPPTHRVKIPSTSSEAPMLDRKFQFNQQVSVSSSDSGRCSLSPASPAPSPFLPGLTYANENMDRFMLANFSALEHLTVDDDDESPHDDGVLTYTLVASNAPHGEPAVPSAAAMMPGNLSALEDTKNEDDDESTHGGCVLSYTLVSCNAPNGEPAVTSGAAMREGNISGLEDIMKDEDDDESSHGGCVLSYTLVSGNAPKGEPVVPIGAAKRDDLTIPSVGALNGYITRHSQFDFTDEQIELFGMSPKNLPCTESEVNYCTGFSLSQPSAACNTSGNYASDIAYAKIESLHQPPLLCDLGNRFGTTLINEQPQDFNSVLPVDSSQNETPTEHSDLVYSIHQLLPPSMNDDLQNDDPVTCGRDHVECGTGKSDFPQMQSPPMNSGYVDHSMFSVQLVA